MAIKEVRNRNQAETHDQVMQSIVKLEERMDEIKDRCKWSWNQAGADKVGVRIG